MMNYEKMTNITDVVTYHAMKQPNSIALVTPNRQLSYMDLENLASKCGSFFIECGVKENDIVVLIIEDEVLLIIALLAIARIGATALSLNPHTPDTYRQTKIKEIDTKILVTDKIDYFIPSLKNIIFGEKEVQWILQTKSDSKKVDSLSSPYFIVMGSGSTGKSKLIPITHQQEIAKVQLSLQWMPKSKHTSIASLSSLYFYTSIIAFLRTMHLGGTFVLLRKNSNPILECQNHYISVLFASVFHVHHMLKGVSQTSENLLKSVDILYITGSFVSDVLKEKIFQYLTKNLYIAYGTNESSTATLLRPINGKISIGGSVGFPLENVHVEVVDANSNILPKNHIGHIRIQTPAMATGYLNDAEATNERFKNGWFYPGDVGKYNNEGELIYLGRSDHMMIMNGINIYPGEIEQYILKYPAVKDAAVIPFPSPIEQNIPVCAVEIDKNTQIDLKQLLLDAYEHLGPSSPKAIVPLEKIPRNELGKLERDKLKHILMTQMTMHNN